VCQNPAAGKVKFDRLLQDGALLPTKARGAQNTDEGWKFSLESGMRVIFMEKFTALGVEKVIAEARRGGGDIPTYISFDVDGLDPVYAPGTGTPEQKRKLDRISQRLYNWSRFVNHSQFL
jgi:guanidinopropionase